ncbi:AMPL [Enterospora canceri]|uniref:AMPL n=1 Tax=Enterospora canceri TaxID=1081671 RepID=A0A1Y1S886_9MICR|nr:AMPL [Enterospora canceri]
MLLRFDRHEKRLQSTTTTDAITVFFYTVNDGGVNLLGCNDEESVSFLNNKNARGVSGEIFSRNERVFCSLGKIELGKQKNARDELAAWSIQSSMGPLYKHVSTYHNGSSVSFTPFGMVEECYFGFILASYKYDHLLKENEDETHFSLVVPEEYTEIATVAHSQNKARFLGDTPSNLLTPTTFCEYAHEIFRGLDKIEIVVVEEERCREMGMNLMLSVGNGSAEPSKLLTVKYSGDSSTTRHKLAMVGKGVVFDSGGISLKPSKDMHRQKMDMMGGATMLLSLHAAARMNLPINATCTVPLVENMPGSKATNPGDIFKAANGIHVEVGNTDAEGRLILADALWYAQNCYGESPEFLIDAATLTGAIKVALGRIFGGFFTNSEAFSDLISGAAERGSELMWRMPLSAYYRKQLDSPVADCNNVGGPMAGASTAGEFLYQFVECEKWAHFDIACLKDESHMGAVYGRGATGRPIRAFYEIVRALSNN